VNFTFLPYPTKVLYFAYHFLATPRSNAVCYRIWQTAKHFKLCRAPGRALSANNDHACNVRSICRRFSRSVV